MNSLYGPSFIEKRLETFFLPNSHFTLKIALNEFKSQPSLNRLSGSLTGSPAPTVKNFLAFRPPVLVVAVTPGTGLSAVRRGPQSPSWVCLRHFRLVFHLPGRVTWVREGQGGSGRTPSCPSTALP